MLEIPVLSFSKREKYVYDFYQTIIQKGDTVIDIGANIGMHTIQFLKLVGTNGHVVSIEPISELASSLAKYQFKHGPKLTIVNAVADQTPGQVDFIVRDDLGLSCVKGYGIMSNPGVNIVAQAITVDSLNVNPTFIKIDVEGYELNVLRGCYNTIKNSRPYFSIESDHMNEVKNFFNEFNYTFIDTAGYDLIALPN